MKAGCLQLYQKRIPQQVLFKVFAQICCYLSKFCYILSFFPPKNLLVVVANPCKVFKIFIPTKIIYTEPDLRVCENLRRIAFQVGA